MYKLMTILYDFFNLDKYSSLYSCTYLCLPKIAVRTIYQKYKHYFFNRRHQTKLNQIYFFSIVSFILIDIV